MGLVAPHCNAACIMSFSPRDFISLIALASLLDLLLLSSVEEIDDDARRLGNTDRKDLEQIIVVAHCCAGWPIFGQRRLLTPRQDIFEHMDADGEKAEMTTWWQL